MESYVRKPNCKCNVCNKEIYRRPQQIISGNTYCSRECYGKANQKRIKCAICNNTFKSGLNKKTCSRACANKQKEGLRYKQLGRPIKDKVKELESLRNRLITLHGYKCCKCEYNKLPILHVHHKIEKSKGGTDDINNLELVCPNCHAEEHFLRREVKHKTKMEDKLAGALS